ncbi:DUF5060 domain-containing protein [Paraglaciecola hydrolytica]|uniref:Alpha-L-rhamnosidase n=1 Tax=Paraglaciecola hydrolytica TaxID=1799789 RepID=A0A148KKG5_9ALTE|nr:DUF5060 domain-containing protein [Paraglaciecola hydrolytica]KXI26765.1 alpha-L-rhamnosidase [Paraglaciecola hydrolytica]
MNKTVLRACLVVALSTALFLSHLANATQVTVEQWDIFQVELEGPKTGNPFVDVRFSAVFENASKKIEVPGFYDGNGKYIVRFMPDMVGQWRYETLSNRWPLTGKRGTFDVNRASKNNHGPVQVHNTYHFAYADGTSYKQIGTTIYNWLDTPIEVQQQTLQTLATSPFNKARMLLTQQPTPYRNKFQPALWPYQGKPPYDWDFTRFNPDFFRHYEKRIGQLRDMGIEADVILFNPYGKFGFNSMDEVNDELYVRYVVARFTAYRNIWWSVANEYDFVRTKTDEDWDRIGQLIQKIDPYNHLRSIHNGKLLFNHNKPWITHVSMQNGVAVQSPGAAEIYRDVYRKPVVYDEIKYEGDAKFRWADLSAQELVHRFWAGTIAGTYVGHGDYFNIEGEDTWTSFGGKLTGNSSPRLAFLRDIMQQGPKDGIDPIDKWQNPDIGGVAGEYYLFYFGHEKPQDWTFSLYKQGISDGMRFKVDIIDTWDMTITPVEGEFVTQKFDNYQYTDAKQRVVKLPGKSGIAIRVTNLDVNANKTKANELIDPNVH